MILLESSECACQWALRSYGFLCLFHLYNLNLGFCILRTGFLSICERFRCWTSAFPSVGTGRFKVPCFLDVIFCLYCQFPGSHLVWQSADLKYNFGNRRRFPLQWLLALCYMGVRSANVHWLLIVVLKDGTGFFDWSVLLCWGVEVGNRLGGSFSWGEEDSGCVVLFWWIEKVGWGWAASPCTAVKDCVNTAFKWFVGACGSVRPGCFPLYGSRRHWRPGYFNQFGRAVGWMPGWMTLLGCFSQSRPGCFSLYTGKKRGRHGISGLFERVVGWRPDIFTLLGCCSRYRCRQWSFHFFILGYDKPSWSSPELTCCGL